MSKVGIKNLHKKSLSYDIGIFFEYNGHGGIVINATILQRLQQEYQIVRDAKPELAAHLLLLIQFFLASNVVTILNIPPLLPSQMCLHAFLRCSASSPFGNQIA